MFLEDAPLAFGRRRELGFVLKRVAFAVTFGIVVDPSGDRTRVVGVPGVGVFDPIAVYVGSDVEADILIAGPIRRESLTGARVDAPDVHRVAVSDARAPYAA